MSVGKKVQQLRKDNELSQEQLAEKLNISRQSISKWESEQSIPDINNIIQLSELFGVTTDYFLMNKDEHSNVKYFIKNANNSVKKNLLIFLVGILVVSLLANLFLWSKLSNLEKITESVMEKNYTVFFDTLEAYSDNLKYILNNDENYNDLDREIEKLNDNVNGLINYASSYGLLSDKLLGRIVWDIATSSRWILREYFLEANEKDITNALNKIDVDKISEFTKVIDEIVDLEEIARKKMAVSIKGFSSEEMADILYSKAIEVVELTILYKYD